VLRTALEVEVEKVAPMKSGKDELLICERSITAGTIEHPECLQRRRFFRTPSPPGPMWDFSFCPPSSSPSCLGALRAGSGSVRATRPPNYSTSIHPSDAALPAPTRERG
jgi:hypothetical protein